MRETDELEPGPEAFHPDGILMVGTRSSAPVVPPVRASDRSEVSLEPSQAGSEPDGSSSRSSQRDELRRRTAELVEQLPYVSPERRRQIREEVISSHVWLATSAVRKFGYRHEHEDLLQVACGGLVEAFDRYDPSQTSYGYFAWVTMNGLLRRYLRDHGWSVRPPRSVQEAANLLRQLGPDLTQELCRTPTAADLAEHLGWSTPQVQAAQNAELGLHTTSLDALCGETWASEHQAEWDRMEARVVLGHAVAKLTDAERELLRLRFTEELTQSQIGARLGVTQMQISRLLTRLMSKLRELIGDLDPSGSEGLAG